MGDEASHLDTECPTCGVGRNEETADLYARLEAMREALEDVRELTMPNPELPKVGPIEALWQIRKRTARALATPTNKETPGE